MAMVRQQTILDLSLQKVPFVRILCFYVIGSLLGQSVVFPMVQLCLCILFLIPFMCLFLLRYRRKTPLNRMVILLTYSFFVVLGYWQQIRDDIALNMHHFSKKTATHIVGIVADEPVVKEKSIRFPLDVKAVFVDTAVYVSNGRLMVTILKSDESIVPQYGDKMLLKGQPTEVPPPYNPNEFDYRKYLYHKGIQHQLFVGDIAYRIMDVDSGNPLLARSLQIRQRLVDKFRLYLKDDQAYQVAIALIFGYRSQVDQETLRAFTNTGTIHVLSVSGLHVGLVFAFLTLLLGWMDRFKYGRQIRVILIFMAVWLYVILTGMAPPILRAGIMISFFLLTLITGRKQVNINTLLASAFFILLFEPAYLFDVGFQLSYLAMLGIFLLYPICCKLYLPQHKLLSAIVAYCYVSVAAQLFTMPFALFYFGQFPNYFLPANLFIALPGTLIMYLGLLLSVCPFEMINDWLGIVLDKVLIVSMEGLKRIEQLPYAIIQGISWNWFQVTCSLCFLMMLVWMLNTKKKFALFGMGVCLLALQISLSLESYRSKNYQGIHVYNVRANLAIADIYKGRVRLLSSLDSLQHPVLTFQVLPDLHRYARERDIEFVPLKMSERVNIELAIQGKKILVSEGGIDTLASSYDWVIWRRNNRNNALHLNARLLLLDGSNSDRYTADFIRNHEDLVLSLYQLKDNFAYVWNGD